VQTVLDRQRSETSAVIDGTGRLRIANDNAAVSARQHRAATQQLGYQFSDLGVQLSMAATAHEPLKMAMLAVTQQGTQVIQALALMKGEATGLIGFLGGPWGQALIAAGSILATLALANSDAADATDKHKEAAEDLYKAMGDLHDAAVQEARSTDASIAADIDKANSLRTRAQETRKAAIAELQLAQQRAADAGASISAGAPGYSNTFNLGRQAAQEAASRGIQAQIAELNATIANGDETVRLKHAALIRRQVESETDKSAAATQTFTNRLSALADQMAAGTITEAAYRAEVRKATDARDAATASANRHGEAHTRESSAMKAAERQAGALAKAEEALAVAAMRAAYAFNQRMEAMGTSSLAGPMLGFSEPEAQTVSQQLEQLGRDAAKATKAAFDGTDRWNESLSDTIRMLGQVGGAAGTLAGVASLISGDLTGVKGPAGTVLQQVANIQLSTVDPRTGDRIAHTIGDELKSVFGKGGVFGDTLLNALAGAGLGVASSSAILGSSGNNFGAAVGGALGEVAGKALGKGMSGLFGSAMGPLGGILGGLAGGLIGNLLASKPKASGTVSNTGVSVGGSGSAVTQLGGLGASLQQSVSNIATQLGATVGNYSVGIGNYKGKYYQVSYNASDSGLGGAEYYKKGSAVAYDGEDATAALRAAIAAAIKQGAFQGVRAGVSTLVNTGSDIEAQVAKAMKYQGVFKSLKAYLDPVGDAVDTVNSKFSELITIFKEANASLADYADLKKLYEIEQQKAVDSAVSQIAGSLKSLLKDLTVGNDTRSLQEREAAAYATLNPLTARVNAGDSTAYDAFAEAASTLLSIERQLYGSTSSYFAIEDQIKAVTQAAVDSEMTKAIAAQDNAGVISAIDEQTATLNATMLAVNSNLITVAELLSAQTASGAAGFDFASSF